MECRIGDTDDRQRIVVDLDRLADDVRIGAEVAPPQTIAENDDRMAARSNLVRRQEGAATLGTNAEDLKVVSGHELGPERAGASTSAETDGGERRAEESRERLIVIAEVLVVGIRHAERTSRTRFSEDGSESRRPVNASERAEPKALGHGEHRGVQADAEHQDADDGERKGRVLRESTDRVANIAHEIMQRVEPPRGPDSAGGFRREQDVAEFLQRRIVCRPSIGPVGEALVLGDGQVRANFFPEVFVVQLPPLQTFEPGNDRHHATPRIRTPVPASSRGQSRSRVRPIATPREGAASCRRV